MTPAERLALLEGAWHLVRVIRHSDGTRARFVGHAVWLAEGPVLRCREDGVLTQAGRTMPATRETLWRADATRLHVAFRDGRPFHSFEPLARIRASHDCPPDTYRLSYDFTAFPRWIVRWDVSGPRKSYRALTRYRSA
ncbi:hypothetical protein SAMN05421775_106177 [Jannaschia aquimarina]|nr:hypothetical protein SAMN05421775_106177 [Jannaschia aquimarina]